METRAQLGAVPRTFIVLVSLALLAALAAGAIVVGSESRARASNGLIAFVHQGDIYTARPDGLERKVLVEAPGQQAAPSWSPDGKRLAYWSSVDGLWQLTVVDADGSNPITVATDVIELTGFGDRADWSPDGKRLAFSARTVKAWEEPCVGSGSEGDFCSSRIFVAAADGSTGAVQTGDTDLDARTAAWSPDGKTIAVRGGDAGEGHRALPHEP